MKGQPPHPSLNDLLQRLEGWTNGLTTHDPLPRDPAAERDLLREAIVTLKHQAMVNKDLHRRVQAAESASEKDATIDRLRHDVAFYRGWALGEFRRLGSACNELKSAYEETLRVNPDGLDCYHSVMDSRSGGGPAMPGQVWANRMSKKGLPPQSFRVVDAVKRLVDEVLELRGKPK
ncbi:hypothetical protein KIKIMORA_01620 [Brevundimonas phage vB_BpoS-Kikimora]|uniref:Uncharacterized protein n=1 Tax=Brevundimonas phage vB_BpoS-Kikimora TaxID=2948601 RepID=A0A9E7SKA2_9CAUD|nr:hypothetical protein KIKIMORA_01620 [Brevundimonas phage vB_BpoS-Kikimora]